MTLRLLFERVMLVTGVFVWAGGIALVAAAAYGSWSHRRYWRSRQGLSKLNGLRTRWSSSHEQRK
jgi:hypothetical protein